jgi:hypothetical protein
LRWFYLGSSLSGDLLGLLRDRRCNCCGTTAALGALGSGNVYRAGVTNGQQTLNLAADTLRHGSRSALLGTLALAFVVGLIVSRRL